MRILYVDDDGETATVVTRLLETRRGDFDVRAVTDPRAGLARVTEEAVDCVVSDLQMPRMDGIAFLERVRDRRPELPWLLYTNAPEEATDRGVDPSRVVAKGDACRELAARIPAVAAAETAAEPRWRSAPSD